MAYFSPLPSFFSVSWCDSRIIVSVSHVRNDLHLSRRHHVNVLVRLRETTGGTDWCKLRVMAHIESNLQCFLLDQKAKSLCQAETDLCYQIRRFANAVL